MFNKIIAHTSFIGETGYANHSRNFFTALNNFIPVKVRNFTVGKTWCGLNNGEPHNDEWYLTDEHKEMLYKQTCMDNGKRIDHYIYGGNEEDEKGNVLHIILNEVNHHYFYDTYNGPKIAYNVWESTLYPDDFFNKLLEFDQLWVPTNWQKDCSVAQGYNEDKIKVIPEAVDGSIFFPEEIKKEDDRFKFLLFGRWDYRKSTKEIIKSFLKTFSKDEPVDLVVSIDNSFSVDGIKTTEDRLKHYGFEDDRIKIEHFPSREKYVNYLKIGDVFLSCARSEGWNLPLIEAMACGTPSIYSDWGAQLEFSDGKGIPVNIVGKKLASHGDSYDKMVYNGIPGNFCEPDYDHLSKVLRDAYVNYKMYKETAITDSEKIRAEFSWENMASKAFCSIKEFCGYHDKEIYSTREDVKWIIDEVYNRRSYEKYFKVEDGDVIVDIGAHIGTFSSTLSDRDFKKCFCIEPEPINVSDLRYNLKERSILDKCEIIQAAIDNETGVSYYNHPDGNRCAGFSEKALVQNEGMKVKTFSFVDFVKEYKISYIDFLKMDCEGGEYSIIGNEENHNFLRNNVSKIAGEIHLGVGLRSKKDGLDLINRLRDLGFKVILNSLDGIDITDYFPTNIDYYTEILFYASKNSDEKKGIKDVAEEVVDKYLSEHNEKSLYTIDTLKYLLKELSLRGKGFNIVETGCSYSMKTGGRTIIFADFIRMMGKGRLTTIDISHDHMDLCKEFTKEFKDHINYRCEDSIAALKSFSDDDIRNIDLFFLDSYDLDIKNPSPSMDHHLKELEAIFDRLSDHTMIAVDDNYIGGNWWMDWITTDDGWKTSSTERLDITEDVGKGILIREFLMDNGWELVNPVVEQENCIFIFKKKIEDFDDGSMEIYQDQYVNGGIEKKGVRECEARYNAMKKVFEQYSRSFTILDIGANFGYYSIRACSDFDAYSIMVEGEDSECGKLVDLCKRNDCSDRLIVLKKRISLYELRELAKCEHFDVVLALNVIHHFDHGEVEEICDIFTKLGDNLILETPPSDDENSCGQNNIEFINHFFESKDKNLLGSFNRHTCDKKSDIYWLKTPKNRITSSFFEYDRWDKWGGVHRNVPVLLSVKTPFEIHSTLDRKEFYNTNKNQKRQWIDGINMRTFRSLNGVYPTSNEILAKIREKDIITEYEWDNKGTDIIDHNFIMSGHNLHLIDYNHEGMDCGADISDEDQLKIVENFFLSDEEKSLNFNDHDKVVILTGSDKKYLPLTELCVNQLSHHLPSNNIFVYGFEFEPEFIEGKINSKKISLEKVKKVGNLQDNTFHFAKIKACLDAIETIDSEYFVWVDADSFVTPNISRVIDCCKDIENYPLAMVYKDWTLTHWREIYGIKAETSYGAEASYIYNISRGDTDFIVGAGLFVFNKKCKEFFEEILKIGKEIRELSEKNIFVDDNAFSEERIFNMLLWKYGYKKHLPITWFSNGWKSDVDNDRFCDSLNNQMIIEAFKKDYDIMCFYKEHTDRNNYIPNDDDVIFIHSKSSIKKPDEVLGILNKYELESISGNKLMIVAHPDDETIFAGNLLSHDDQWKIISVTGDGDDVRKKEFEMLMKKINNENYEIWDFEDSLNNGFPKELQEKIKSVLSEAEYSVVVTHNPNGEYGHVQHKSLYNIVSEIISNEKMYVFDTGDRLSDRDIKDKKDLLRVYKSQATDDREGIPILDSYKKNIYCEKITSIDDYIKKYLKKIFICFDSKSLGDNIAWMPYAEEFRKKHNCKIILSTFWNNFFEKEYPEIEFIGRGEVVHNINGQYNIGWYSPWNPALNPIDYRTIPLQQTASDILGLDYKEIRPKISIPDKPRTIEDKYVCIGIHSTAQAKYWNYPDGWQKVTDYLNEKGYKVVHISKEQGVYMENTPPNGIIDKTGDYSIEDRLVDLKYADMFIGIGSGLSWLSWAVGTPTVLISGFSAPFCEPTEGIERIHNPHVCNSCFNDSNITFDPGDWNWCPRNKDFECSKSITPEMVIEKIDKIIKKENK